MPECECIKKCPFFNDKMKGMGTIKEMMKKKYCLGDNTNCARYMVFRNLGSEAVPPDLPPNKQDRARQIISSSAKV